MFLANASLIIIFSGCNHEKYNATSTGFTKVLEYLEKSLGKDVEVDELRFIFNDDTADKNTAIRMISIEFQSKSNQNQLERMTYTDKNGWGAIEPIQFSSDEDEVEMYDFEDEVNSLSLVKGDVLEKVYNNALKKSSEQYSDRLMSSILIDFKKGKDVIYETTLKRGTGKRKTIIHFGFDKNGNLKKY